MKHLESFTGAGSSVTGERRVSLATAFIERCGIGDGGFCLLGLQVSEAAERRECSVGVGEQRVGGRSGGQAGEFCSLLRKSCLKIPSD